MDLEQIRRRLLLMCSMGVVGLPAAFAQDIGSRPSFEPVTVVRPFAPITEFEIKRVGEVMNQVNPAETVLGVTIGDSARAYPINMLTGPRREIANDSLGGTAIAATW